MTESPLPQKLRVVLCYAQDDKSKVRELYNLLKSEPSWIEPWLDEEILPGQDWKMEITEAIRNAHVIIVCLSATSVEKEGHFHAEINHALDVSAEKPEHMIFIIPLKFDEIDESKVPSRLRKYQYYWAGNSLSDTFPRLFESLKSRAKDLHLNEIVVSKENGYSEKLELYLFNKIVAEEIPYTFYISKYPVTNAQYQRFLNSPDYTDPEIWSGFSNFTEDYIQIGEWGKEGWDWLTDKSKSLVHKPAYWDDNNLDNTNLDHPVVGVTWYEANAYCRWLHVHYSENSLESIANRGFSPKQIRLPLELEWEIAAGGITPESRYPWDRDGKITQEDQEVARRANVNRNINHTTSVNAYPRGISPYGVMDMGGNVWEWQANFYDKQHKGLALRGGSWKYYQYGARVSRRYTYLPDDQLDDVGFRIVITV